MVPPAKARKTPRGKKGMKKKAKLRKFNLDLFGLLTFTRVFGAPFELFMYSGGGNKKGDKGPKGPKGRRRGKKDAVSAPKLQSFPEILPAPILREDRALTLLADLPAIKKLIIPTTNYGYREKTTRKFEQSLFKGGSLRDTLCGPNYPLPPRPQPHGGVFGDLSCSSCTNAGGLLKTKYGLLHKKMKKLLKRAFDKAQFVLEYMLESTEEAIKSYGDLMSEIALKLDPILEELDTNEWTDHQKTKDKARRLREVRVELEILRRELASAQRSRKQDTEDALKERVFQTRELESQISELKGLLNEMFEALEDWKEGGEGKLEGPRAELASLVAKLEQVKDSVEAERDSLRTLLAWEEALASEETQRRMDDVIAEDIAFIFEQMHPAWFKLLLENEDLAQELNVIEEDTHLLQVEVDTLRKQRRKLLEDKKAAQRVRLGRFRPEMTMDDLYKSLLPCGPEFRLDYFPTTKLIHE